MTIGERVKTLRVKKGITQKELAIKVGYTSRTSIAKLEADKIDIPMSKLVLLAEALDSTPIILAGWEK